LPPLKKNGGNIMKKLLVILAVVTLVSGFSVSNVLAYSFDFAGGFSLEDNGGVAGFAETLDFNAALSGKSFLQMLDPNPDGVLDGESYVKLSEFTLDESTYVSGESYSFINNPYVDGFEVYDKNDNLLMQADIELAPIIIDGGTGSINASFGLNLTNIDVLVTGSDILDALGAADPGGAVDFTFNIAGTDLSSLIESSEGGMGSYSASVAPVPEPGTVLLIGAGLLGLIGLGRKRIKK
jgi:hypothetical protein